MQPSENMKPRADKGHHFQRRRERAMRCRRDAVLVHGHTPDPGNFFGHLGRRQHAAVSGFGALADLELDHLDLVVARDPGEFFRIERAVAMAAADISRADLPDQIAEMLNTEAEYGRLQSGPPMLTRNFSSACGFGATEWCIHS